MSSVPLREALDRARSLYQSGRLEEAVRLYESIARQAPDEPGPLLDLGLAHFLAGALDAAQEAYSRALDIAPKNAAALKSLGVIAFRRGETPQAVARLVEAIQAEPEEDTHWATLANVLGNSPDASRVPAEVLDPILQGLLQHEAVGSRDLGSTLVAHFLRTPGLGELLRLEDARAVEARLQDPEAFAPFSSPAFRLSLTLGVLPDLGFERVIQGLRRTLVLAAAEGRELRPLHELELLCGLAQQCFLSGYVHPFERDEQEAVEALVMRTADRALTVDDAPAVALLAAYVPLVQWERAEDCLYLARDLGSPHFAALVKQQILDPVREAELRERIPVLSTVEDETSATVREMYESHPYPQWVRAPRLPAMPLAEYLRHQFPTTAFPALEGIDSPRILIAGAGTGLHPIQTHRAIENAQVVAVDISLSSLSYAARKAAEMGLERIGFVHGDILALGDWDETFDVVESVGVLHHMRDPVAGWRALIPRLAPHGVMRIGLYSELARAGVVEIRERLAEEVAVAEDEDIRDVRQKVIRFLQDHPQSENILQWRDFYSLQEFRDLILHPQEHRYTLPQLAGILDELELEFLGFGPVPANAERAFRERFPEEGALRNLDHWHLFETEHPQLFRGMYQFWVRPRR